MKQVTINLYSFSELPESAKQKAIEEHRVFELSTMQPSHFKSGDREYDTEAELQKTYAEEYKYYLENDEPIIEAIEANDYLFFADGNMVQSVTYTEICITETTIGGETYILS